MMLSYGCRAHCPAFGTTITRHANPSFAVQAGSDPHSPGHGMYCTLTRNSISSPPSLMLCSAAGNVTSQQTVSSHTSSIGQIQVVLTREAGKNGKLAKALAAKGVACLEMPLIETSPGPDRAKLPAALKSDQYDWVCITSPEAASVFLEGWRQAGKPAVRVAVVGDGTGKVLLATGEDAVAPQFTPSVANAEHFGPELPFLPSGSNRVLYPASNKASSILQEGLLARGFEVVRLNTYDTVPVTTLDESMLQRARQAAVVALASPSALRAWMQFAGAEAAAEVAVAAIGSTTARAAEKAGLEKIFYPEKPGLDTFVTSIMDALRSKGQV